MADVILYNGSVYTVDREFSVAEAVAVRGKRIVGVGSTDDILSRFEAKEMVDLQGKTVYPGFIDAHAHFLGLGISLRMLDFVGTSSPDQITAMVRDRVRKLKPGQWIRGRGWDQNDWSVKKFPTHEILDAVGPNNPVYLGRIDGHAVWVNRIVMDLAGITGETRDPEGGRILRDDQGNPTGIFIDNAIDLLTPIIPEYSSDELEEAGRLASRFCAQVGLTSVQDMGANLREIEALKELVREVDFPVRLYVSVQGSDTASWRFYLQHGKEVGLADNKLTIRSLKLYVDGALGSRGAALIDSYSDEPGNRGLTRTSEDELQRMCREAFEGGFQVCTHAIGDRGNHIVLNVYEEILQERRTEDHRFRVEHVQVLHPDDIPRFRELNVLPSMQPTHCTSDMYWAVDRVGPDRIEGAYAWRSLLESGVIIPGGSDFPVENPNPLWGIYAAVTRQDHQGWPEGGWYPEERMTIEEAIRSFTVWAAFAAFEEEMKGSIESGKLADLVVLSNDIVTIDPDKILSTEVLRTMVGGSWVYRVAEELATGR
ncbi:MAG: amidohydrolase [Bacteroidota bacterium]